MPELRNIKCTIHTAQGELAEFEDKNPDSTLGQENAANTITRYLNISGTTGQRFWIQIEAQSGFEWGRVFNCLSPSYIIDGIPLVGSGSCRKSGLQYHGPVFSKEVNGKIAQFTSNMFFKELKVVEMMDGNTICSPDDKRIQELGRIEIRVLRSFSVKMPNVYTCKPMHKSLANVHEKALKGRSTSHGVHLDGESIAAAKCAASHTYFDTLEVPYVTFVFIYHTHESLQNLGVIPRSSSPDVEMQQTPEQLQQEIERLASQLSQKKATLKRRLGGADDSGTESKYAIKKEKGASSRASASKRVKAEIVDLTNED